MREGGEISGEQEKRGKGQNVWESRRSFGYGVSKAKARPSNTAIKELIGYGGANGQGRSSYQRQDVKGFLSSVPFFVLFCFESVIYNPLHAARRAMAGLCRCPLRGNGGVFI